MAADAQQPTFSWAGCGRPQGSRTYYEAFHFSGDPYRLGDCVYLLPEEEGAAPYIAKLLAAYEDAAAPEAERLVIEVQWFERRGGSVPPLLSAAMHEREVVESDLADTNLVGCLDRKATIVRADCFEQAVELLPPGCRKGEWHFCRGVLQSEGQVFTTYSELGHSGFSGVIGASGNHSGAAVQGNGGFCSGDYGQQDEEMAEAAGHTSSGANTPTAAAAAAGGPAAACAANSRSRRAAAAARVAAAAAAAGATPSGNTIRGIPGKVCCECGATQTPQWREGPLGPKTLCNACGVRYQRSQSKAKSNKRLASERARERGSPLHSRAAKQACLAKPGDAAQPQPHTHATRASVAKGAARQQPRGAAAATAHRSGGAASQQAPAPPQPQQHAASGDANGAHQPSNPEQQQQQQHRGDGRPQHRLGEAHYYAEEGSPPNINTHILEVDEEEEAGQQQGLAPAQQPPARPAAPQQPPLSVPLHQLHVSAAFGGGAMGSPASAMLLSEPLQGDAMPLLSLDDKLGGPDCMLPGLAGPDGLEQALSGVELPGQALSPMQPRGPRPPSATPSRLGVTASAVCASPGRLIAAMVQGLRLPAPLSLNGPGTAVSAPPSASAPQQLSSAALLLSGLGPPGQLSLGAAQAPCHQLLNGGAGLLLPALPGSNNASSGTAATTPCQLAGCDSQPASAAVSSCDVGGPAASAAANNAACAAGGAGGGPAAQPCCGAGPGGSLLSQLRSLVFRASAYSPDVQGLGGLYPGPPSPRAMEGLSVQLDQLPQQARARLQQVAAAMEDHISRAKAAEAAVLAVSQVLAAKQQAAASARQDVEASLVQFRGLLREVSPAVAAAAAGNCPAAAVAAAAAAGGACGVPGSGRLGGNSPRVLVAHRPADGARGFDLDGDEGGLGAGGCAAMEAAGDASGADDLLCDPEEAGGPGGEPQPDQQQPDQGKQQQQQQQCECKAAPAQVKAEPPAGAAPDEGPAAAQRQAQQLVAAAMGGGAVPVPAPPASAAHSAAEAAPVAA